MKKRLKIFPILLLTLAVSVSGLFGCAKKQAETAPAQTVESTSAAVETTQADKAESTSAVETTQAAESTYAAVEKDGEYSTKDEVAAYIHEYGTLPSNYITKTQAEKLGWVSSKGNLWDVAPGKSIGGGKFGNYEGLLPEKNGRQYYECDVNYEGGYRGDDRIIYSNDGLIYFTDDHYETFELLYGEE